MDGWMEGRQTGIAGGGQLHFEEEEEARRPPLDGWMNGWTDGGRADGSLGAGPARAQEKSTE